jgi:hypothetical protein
MCKKRIKVVRKCGEELKDMLNMLKAEEEAYYNHGAYEEQSLQDSTEAQSKRLKRADAILMGLFYRLSEVVSQIESIS